MPRALRSAIVRRQDPLRRRGDNLLPAAVRRQHRDPLPRPDTGLRRRRPDDTSGIHTRCKGQGKVQLIAPAAQVRATRATPEYRHLLARLVEELEDIDGLMVGQSEAPESGYGCVLCCWLDDRCHVVVGDTTSCGF